MSVFQSMVLISCSGFMRVENKYKDFLIMNKFLIANRVILYISFITKAWLKLILLIFYSIFLPKFIRKICPKING